MTGTRPIGGWLMADLAEGQFHRARKQTDNMLSLRVPRGRTSGKGGVP